MNSTKLIGLFGVATLALGGITYAIFKNKKLMTYQPIKKELVILILEELKYQTWKMCYKFAQAFVIADKKMKTKGLKQHEINKYKQSQLLKIFEGKQQQILNKYNITIDNFKYSLSNIYKKERQVQSFHEQIQQILLNASNGNPPPLTVPQQFKKSLNPSEAFNIFKDLNIYLLQTLIQKVQPIINNTQSFNPEHLSQIVKNNNIFQQKKQYVKKNNPNMIANTYFNFNILMQIYKKQSQDFKNKTQQIQTIYMKLHEYPGQLEDVKKKFNNITLKQRKTFLNNQHQT